MAIASTIQDNISRGRKMLAVLIDPEKADASRLDTLCPLLNEGKPDFIFVGGSTGTQIEQVVLTLKQRTTIPVVLFPGNVSQFTPSADALLVLSLLSSRNPEFLIGAQVRAARRILSSGIDTLSVGYILVDGGRPSSVQQMTYWTQPLRPGCSDFKACTWKRAAAPKGPSPSKPFNRCATPSAYR